MIFPIDTRDFTTNRATAARTSELRAEASSLSAVMPENFAISIPNLNSFSGTPNSLVLENMPSTNESLIDQALSFVAQASASFGFAPNEPVEFVPDPEISTTSSGDKVVQLQQTYRGIPIFQMGRTVTFSPSNVLSNVTGDNINIAPGINTAPKLKAEDAVLAAALYLVNSTKEITDQFGQTITPIRVDVSNYTPQVLIEFTSMSSKPTVFDKGPFVELISAHLVFLYLNPETRLGWRILITMPDIRGLCEVIVSADHTESEILYGQSLTSMILAEGNVYKENPDTTPREMIPFPRKLNDYPISQPAVPIPSEFPGHWCASDKCIGNNTIATLGQSSTTLRGMTRGGKVVFDPIDGLGDDQKILNIFYFCNYMHDFFYMLGFDEAAGNFQEINFTNQGTASDPVKALAHSGTVPGTANMSSPPDGRKPVMNMGLVASTGRHTAFDADVVFHEFTHGVTNRLVGGRMNSPMGLQQPQSRGMGEGWSDYFALTIQNFDKRVEKVVTGNWVVNNPNGIRGLKYDSDFPDHFDKLGKGRYNEEHNIGEIWCATLMEMNREIGGALGSQNLGHQIGWQIVVDALKLSPSNPSFLDERDAILKALEGLHVSGRLNDTDYRKVKKAVWTTFAKFGMGPNADCIGASLNGIVADFTVPTGL